MKRHSLSFVGTYHHTITGVYVELPNAIDVPVP